MQCLALKRIARPTPIPFPRRAYTSLPRGRSSADVLGLKHPPVKTVPSGFKYYSTLKHKRFDNPGSMFSLWAIGGLALLGLGYSGIALTQDLYCESALAAASSEASVIESDEYAADPSTSILFPRKMTVKTSAEDPTRDLTLLGVGVRTVSFLRLPVYVVGFYADLEGAELHKSPMDPEQKIEWLIRHKCVAVRIVPNRNTSYQHLRDAYVRSVQGRLTALRKALEEIQLTANEEEAVQESIQKLKALFPTTALQKHTPLQIILSAPSERGGLPRSLIIPRLGGQVDNTWVGVELMRAYFEGDGISPKMKKSVMGAVERI